MVIVERPRRCLINIMRNDGRVERAPQQAGLFGWLNRDMNQRRSLHQRQLDDLGGPAAPAGRLPIPNRENEVAVRDAGASGEDVALQRVLDLPRKLQHPASALDQTVEPLQRPMLERRPIG